MKPEILRISQVSKDKSVICILGSNVIPEYLTLSNSEKEFAGKRLNEKEEFIFINSYNKCTYLVRLKEGKSHYKTREELRKTAYNIRILIKENNHTELVIASDHAYKGAVEDFTE